METNQDNTQDILLQYADGVRLQMERQGIGETHVRQVVAQAERTGSKLLDAATARTIAHLRIGKITCWVQYTQRDGGYMVYQAYVHRMEIEGES